MIAPPRKTHRVAGASGVSLFVGEWGDPDGPPILFIHGWSQAHQSWARQLSGALDRFRLVALDLRGHGQSDKPAGAEHYDSSEPWANDIAAVIAALGLEKPVLVGWSMGGWVLQDYLRVFGDSAIAGVSLVGTTVATGNYTPPEALRRRKADAAVRADGMFGADMTANLTATLDFVHACFHRQPDADDLALMVGFNMLCPPDIRAAARGRSEDYRPEMAQISVPALVQYGAHERVAVPPMPQSALDTIPGARGIEYPNSGHAPFWEEHDRFNADLAAFVDACVARIQEEVRA